MTMSPLSRYFYEDALAGFDVWHVISPAFVVP